VNSNRRTTALLASAIVVVSACGSSDDGAADRPATEDAGTVLAAPTEGGGPNATIAVDLPEAYEGVVGPVEVIGDALPPLTTNDFSADPAVGNPAPVLVGLGYDGRTIRLDPAADGPTMVVFLAHWCPHCNDEIPVLLKLRDDNRIPDEVNVIAVSTAVTPGQPNFPPDEWLDDKDWTYPAIADGVDLERDTWIAADAYGVSGFPFVVLVDAAGNVAARWSGERPPSEIAGLLASLPSIA